MFRTNVTCMPAGRFHGHLGVSMRPLTPAQAIDAVVITSRFPQAHGAPVHFGDPERIGISDLMRPDFGEAVAIHDDEAPVFWACGVTPQAVLMEVQPEFAITYRPGCMFVTDQPAEAARRRHHAARFIFDMDQERLLRINWLRRRRADAPDPGITNQRITSTKKKFGKRGARFAM